MRPNVTSPAVVRPAASAYRKNECGSPAPTASANQPRTPATTPCRAGPDSATTGSAVGTAPAAEASVAGASVAGASRADTWVADASDVDASDIDASAGCGS